MIRPPPKPPLFPYTTLFRSPNKPRIARNEFVSKPLHQRCPSSFDRGNGRFLHIRFPVSELCGSDKWKILAGASSESILIRIRSEEHTSELQSHVNIVCRLLL